MNDRSKTGHTYSLTTLIRINRLAVSTISGVKTVSPARELGLHADILAQLVHSAWRKSCVSHWNGGDVRTPFVFVRYFIGMSRLSVGQWPFPGRCWRGCLP